MINGYSEEIPLMQYVNDWNLYIKKKSLLLDIFFILQLLVSEWENSYYYWFNNLDDLFCLSLPYHIMSVAIRLGIIH